MSYYPFLMANSQIKCFDETGFFLLGETYELRNDLVVRPFKTHHVITSQVNLQSNIISSASFTGGEFRYSSYFSI